MHDVRFLKEFSFRNRALCFVHFTAYFFAALAAIAALPN